MDAHCYDLSIRVLLYKEGKSYVAHALELDLLGYGDTEAQARKELEDALECQMSFATQKSQPEMLNHPAPKEFFDRWEKAHGAALRGLLAKDKPAKMAVKAAFIPLPLAARRTAGSGAKFQRAADPVCA